MDAAHSVECQYGILESSAHLRMPGIDKSQPVCEERYRSKFEWTMEEANAAIDDEIFKRGWTEFAPAYPNKCLTRESCGHSPAAIFDSLSCTWTKIGTRRILKKLRQSG
jgi:hypothetical protein